MIDVARNGWVTLYRWLVDFFVCTLWIFAASVSLVLGDELATNNIHSNPTAQSSDQADRLQLQMPKLSND